MQIESTCLRKIFIGVTFTPYATIYYLSNLKDITTIDKQSACFILYKGVAAILICHFGIFQDIIKFSRLSLICRCLENSVDSRNSAFSNCRRPQLGNADRKYSLIILLGTLQDDRACSIRASGVFFNIDLENKVALAVRSVTVAFDSQPIRLRLE